MSGSPEKGERPSAATLVPDTLRGGVAANRCGAVLVGQTDLDSNRIMAWLLEIEALRGQFGTSIHDPSGQVIAPVQPWTNP
jgi:hypothetical protein